MTVDLRHGSWASENHARSRPIHPEMANTLIKWATIAEPIAQRILIYDGDEKFQFKGIEVVPWRMVGRDEQDNVLTGLRQD